MIQLIPGINSTSSALNAERIRIEVVSQNLANANTSRGLDGKPYQRQQVVFETVLQRLQQGSGAANMQPQAVRVAQVSSDQRPPRLIHNPNHPDADAQGMVALPNINIYHEMVDLISASRAFEANLAAIKTARTMAMQTMGIGRA